MTKQFSDEQLLKMAMGVVDEETAGTVDIMKHKQDWLVIPERQRDRLTKRKKMRHNLFKVIKKVRLQKELDAELAAIKSIIDPQLNANHQINWATFTFYWDIHPDNHTKIVTKDRWFLEGGRYDELGALQPTAFTQQEI